MSKFLIIGAKGFAKELLEAVVQREADAQVTFYDDITVDLPTLLFNRYPILRRQEDVIRYFAEVDRGFSLGIGKPALREQFYRSFVLLGGEPRTVISPRATIGSFGNEIGLGSTIMCGTVITNDIRLGIGCLLNLNVTVGHDSSIGDFCELSPGVHVSGNVTLGEKCVLGTGAVVLPNISLGSNITVGAGAVVNRDFSDGETLVGIPAKPLQRITN
mgnify:CR=1 FL=1